MTGLFPIRGIYFEEDLIELDSSFWLLEEFFFIVFKDIKFHLDGFLLFVSLRFFYILPFVANWKFLSVSVDIALFLLASEGSIWVLCVLGFLRIYY